MARKLFFSLTRCCIYAQPVISVIPGHMILYYPAIPPALSAHLQLVVKERGTMIKPCGLACTASRAAQKITLTEHELT